MFDLRAIIYIHLTSLCVCALVRLGHSSGTEAEADPHAPVHAPRCSVGFPEQGAAARACIFVPLYAHGDRYTAHLHAAFPLCSHPHSQTGVFKLPLLLHSRLIHNSTLLNWGEVELSIMPGALIYHC